MAVNRWAVLEAELWADLGEVQLTPEVRPEPGVRGGEGWCCGSVAVCWWSDVGLSLYTPFLLLGGEFSKPTRVNGF